MNQFHSTMKSAATCGIHKSLNTIGKFLFVSLQLSTWGSQSTEFPSNQLGSCYEKISTYFTLLTIL